MKLNTQFNHECNVLTCHHVINNKLSTVSILCHIISNSD